MNNRLGINLWNWTERYTDSHLPLLQKAAALGYQLVEVGLDQLDFDPAALRQEADRLGLALSCCAAMIPGRDLSNQDPQVRAHTAQYLGDCVRMAETLGADRLVGPLYAGGGRARMVDADQRTREWDWAVTGLGALARQAQSAGVLLCLEPLTRYKTDMVNRACDAARLCRDIGETNLAVLFDSYQAGTEEQSLPQALEELGPLLGHFHANESHRGCPGTGHVDWQGCFAALRRMGYTGPVVLESFCPTMRDNAFRPVEESRDALAQRAAAFLKGMMEG